MNNPNVGTINNILRRKTAIKRLIANLVAAEIAYSWKGAADPSEIAGLESDVREARKNLDRVINAALDLTTTTVLKGEL